MIDNVKPENILFLDIETVPQYENFHSMPFQMQEFWIKKAENLKTQQTPEELYSRAGIYAEFGKIVCVSVGFFNFTGDQRRFRLKSFYGENEKELLERFTGLLNTHYNKKESNLCGHNSREFDFPYISRRMLINGLKLPELLNVSGRKPWEVCLIDTMDLWKFGDYKSYTSLSLLASVFNIRTPKDDISGKDVGNVYWKQKDLRRIASYCEKDVLTVAQIFLKFRGERILEEEEIIFIKDDTGQASAN